MGPHRSGVADQLTIPLTPPMTGIGSRLCRTGSSRASLLVLLLADPLRVRLVFRLANDHSLFGYTRRPSRGGKADGLPASTGHAGLHGSLDVVTRLSQTCDNRWKPTGTGWHAKAAMTS